MIEPPHIYHAKARAATGACRRENQNPGAYKILGINRFDAFIFSAFKEKKSQ